MFFFPAPLFDRAELHDQLKVAQKIVIVLEHCCFVQLVGPTVKTGGTMLELPYTLLQWFADGINSVPHPSENLIQLRIQMYGVCPSFVCIFLEHLMELR